MKTFKIILIILFVLFGIHTIYTLSISDLAKNPIPNLLGWTATLTLIPITTLFVAYTWYWLSKRMSRQILNIRNRLNATPNNNNDNIEYILRLNFILTLFFLTGGISATLGILTKYGELSQLGILSIAYGVGLIGTKRLIQEDQDSSA